MNKIKTCLVFLFTIALSAFAAACSSNNDEAVTPEIVIPENILTNGLNFSKAGGTNTLSIKANVSLEVTSSQTWCTVTPVSSTSDTVFKYMVNVEPNTGKERMGTITFALGDLMKTVTVTQLAGETDEPGSNEIAGETPWAVSNTAMVWLMKQSGAIRRQHKPCLTNWLPQESLPCVSRSHGWDILE